MAFNVTGNKQVIFQVQLTAIPILVVKAVSALFTSGWKAQEPTMGGRVCSDSLFPVNLISHHPSTRRTEPS